MIFSRLRAQFIPLLAIFMFVTLTACGGSGGGEDNCDPAQSEAGAGFGGCEGTDADTDPATDPGAAATLFRFGYFNASGTFIENAIGAGSTTVNGGESTNLTVAVVDATGAPAIGLSGTVQFGSICAGQGLAEISPLQQSLSSGGAVVQYTALNCSGTDKVFATIQIEGTSLTANVDLTTTPCSGPCSGGQTGLPGGSVVVLTSAPQLPSASDTEAEAITVTALVRDSNNVAQAGIPVNLSASSGLLILGKNSVTTDDAGQVEAKLHTAGDPTNRDITVFASVSGAGSSSASVNVVGTKLEIDGPSAASDSVVVSYTLTLTNSAGEAISGETINIAQDLGAGPSSVVTNAAGQAVLEITVSGAGAVTRTITATSALIPAPTTQTISIAPATLSFVSPTPASNAELNISSAHGIRARLVGAGGASINACDLVFTTTRGAFGGSSVATVETGMGVAPIVAGEAEATFNTGGVAGLATVQVSTRGSADDPQCPTSTPISISRTIEIVATAPATVSVQASPSTVPVEGSASVAATVRDANNNPVKNQIVNFTIENYPSGSLTAASAITGSDGIARVTFNAGTAVSSTNGVTIRAKVGSLTIEDTAQLTVTGQAVRVNLGFGRELLDPAENTTFYQLPVAVTVTDPAGNPAASAVVNLKLRATAYQKGHYVAGTSSWIAQYHAPTIQSLDDSLEPSFGCLSEDRNENGIRDGKTGGNIDGNGTNDGAAQGADGFFEIPSNTVVGEDINDNNVLDPQNSATVPATVTMAEDGTAEFFITYPKSEGSWLQVRIDATTQVGGTEGKAIAFATLNITADDAKLDAAPPGVLRAICDFNGDIPGGVNYRTEAGECDQFGVNSNPALATVGSPYGEIGSCQYAN